ncbi:MAG: FtsK/SpoIIIE domain-containing protein [Chloroflexota bacterium]|nr:FtsK/SpoIIIE domain-containing protein [Chloroflexota bacterium]
MINMMRVRSEKKKYEAALVVRQKKHEQSIKAFRQELDKQVSHQKTILEHAYPSPKALVEIGLARGKFRRLWYRRLGIDSDFLSLRVGQYAGLPSYKILSPTSAKEEDDMAALSFKLLDDYKQVAPQPFNLPMSIIGSLGICGNEEKTYQVTQRLLLDAFIHHAPTDLLVVILSDRPNASERWRMYKWLPHTRVLQSKHNFSGLALDKESIDIMTNWLAGEFDRRREIDSRYFQASDDIPFILTIFDDGGHVRQDPEVSSMIKWGNTCRMPSIILGDFALPQIRARLDIQEKNKFRYIETWEGGTSTTGVLDKLPSEEISKVCRTLAGLEMITESEQSILPESLPLSMTVEDMWLSAKAVENKWQRQYQDHELLQFPAGVYINKKDIVPFDINLLPAERGGFDAYHTILIGTTGSGKSEFMKSLVLVAAYRYPPDLLNFFFMDFKGGAAFDPFKDLPHVSGIVTNLQPELVNRGLIAVQSEIARRQAQFAEVEVRDIWAFNQIPGGEHLPHLWLMLDEFAKGLSDFPELNPMLDLLVRQGRSLGMYLLLANQDVNSSVNKLLSNVGWRIALKVSRRDELKAILEEKLNPTMRPGHGYVRTPQGGIIQFQAGYGGFEVLEQGQINVSKGFEILLVEDNGQQRRLYKHETKGGGQSVGKPKVTEQERLIDIMVCASQEMKLTPAHKIYHDPLPPIMPLSESLRACRVFRTFEQGAWSGIKNKDQFLKIPLGFNDHIESGRQFPLQIDFTDKDGHLWIVGAVGSGKELTLSSLLLSIAVTHLPEEAQFYIIEGGSGALKSLEALPHTGAVIRLSEKERLQRLLDFITATIEKRQVGGFGTDPQNQHSQPHLFLVINNFAEFRNIGYELLEKIASFIQGGRVGIHLIFVSNLSRDIPGKLASNLARKLVLQQANKDEFLNFLPRHTAPLSFDVPGRGYWVDESVMECQVGQPTLLDEEGDPLDFNTAAKQMQACWDGDLPRDIQVLPESIPLAEFLQQYGQTGDIPVGIDYQTLSPIFPKMSDLVSVLLILGETRCGKSNFLLNLVETFQEEQDWQIHAVCLRPSLLRSLSGDVDNLKVYANEKACIEGMAGLPEKLRSDSALPEKLLILIDDLGAAFEPGQTELEALLDNIARELRQREHQDFLLVASGQINEFRMKSGTNTLVRLLNQNKTGLCFSQDMQAWGWMGVTPQEIRPFSKMTLPVGRGFFINRGSLQVVQTPLSKYSRK